jgi:hypothetical protein
LYTKLEIQNFFGESTWDITVAAHQAVSHPTHYHDIDITICS